MSHLFRLKVCAGFVVKSGEHLTRALSYQPGLLVKSRVLAELLYDKFVQPSMGCSVKLTSTCASVLLLLELVLNETNDMR